MDKYVNKMPILIGAFSTLVALIFLNRWFATDIGILSFGRTWQYFVSWGDFGFARRELWGTLLTITGINKVFSNEYVFAYVFYALEILLEAGLLIYYAARKVPREDNWFFIALFFCPALLLQGGYLSGTQDLQLLIVATIAILYSEKNFSFVTLCVIGIFTHELFIFMLPAVCAIYLIRKKEKGVNYSKKWVECSLYLLVLVAAILFIHFFGKLEVQKDVYESIMSNRIPDAAGEHSLWSGYYEVSSSLGSNASSAFSTPLSVITNLKWTALPLSYLVLVILTANSYMKPYRSSTRIVTLFLLLLPLFASLVATDFYRWLGMSVNLAWLLILTRASGVDANRSGLKIKMLVAFVIVAPLGAAEISRPFPAQQLILEKISRADELSLDAHQHFSSRSFLNVSLLSLPVEVRGIESRNT